MGKILILVKNFATIWPSIELHKEMLWVYVEN